MTNKKTTLAKKLRQYSAITAPLLAGATMTSGQVIYTDIEPDVTLTLGSGYELDLNNDGEVDFKLKVSTYGTNWYRACIAPYPFYTTNQNAFAGYKTTFGNGLVLGYASAFSMGQSIDANADFKVLNDLLFSYNGNMYFVYAALLSTYAGATYGQWSGGAIDRYLALRITHMGSMTHYGWARCAVKEDAKELTIKDYAYEATPDQGIQAGIVIGLSEAPQKTFRIFAFEGVVHIVATDDRLDGTQISIVNTLGQTIVDKPMSSRHERVDLNDKGEGLYVVTVRRGQEEVIRKVSAF